MYLNFMNIKISEGIVTNEIIVDITVANAPNTSSLEYFVNKMDASVSEGIIA